MEKITSSFPTLNKNQIQAISNADGPVQIIAGPGSGKTFVLVLRSLFILLTGRAQPTQILLTTFTEKAAFELRDRINEYARILGYQGPLYEMQISTLHSMCDGFIRRYVTHAPLKRNYETLDELTQTLFLNENFNDIVPESMKIGDKYLGRWEYKWTTIKALIPYLNKITEEMIDVECILKSEDEFLQLLGEAFRNYEKRLFESNRLDFAHQQSIFYEMLVKRELQMLIRQDLRYIMVDEYQDTNFIQEQILFKLARPTNNLCIVGDEDQSLYRFRGATVRNILEFQTHFRDCKQIILDTNYRSHREIII